MSNSIYEIDLLRSLPESLKRDPNMLGLASTIGEGLQSISKNIKNNLIYARIDELSEDVLDILAYDLHIDWYDYAYPIEAKRDLIKTSVKVHKRLGTKYAVETALGGLHPNSYIEEWFEYEGTPRRFRVVLDITNSRVIADYLKINKVVDIYKRKTAILETVISQITTGLDVEAVLTAHTYTSPMCGQLKCRSSRGLQ